jgi:hypothetical protein
MIIYSYIASHGFSVKFKREGLIEKLICREETESEHAKELPEKKV